MGKFEGILIASDWDGTLCLGAQIPQSNVDAIRYFQSEGGLFTVCSGRYYPYLLQFKDSICANTYLITLNGAVMIDPESMEPIYEGVLPVGYVEILDEIILKRGLFKSITFYEKGSLESVEVSTERYLDLRERLRTSEIYKILLIADNEEEAQAAVEYVNSFRSSDFVAVRSWDVSAEIISKNNTKGAALRRLREATGASKVIAVGDYENDIAMLLEADIGYAVENASPAVKRIADRITVPASVGALSKIINELDKEMESL